jgi:hypothetical protein
MQAEAGDDGLLALGEVASVKAGSSANNDCRVTVWISRRSLNVRKCQIDARPSQIEVHTFDALRSPRLSDWKPWRLPAVSGRKSRSSASGPRLPLGGGRSMSVCPIVQTSTCSPKSRHRRDNKPRFRSADSPARSAHMLPVRRWISLAFIRLRQLVS